MKYAPQTPPVRPIVAVLAVVIHDGAVLLVQRANPPDAGLWGFPGGKIEFGEPMLAAAERELFEETGVTAAAKRIFTALDAYDRSEDGELRQHFVLVAVWCQWRAGTPVAADDALDANWVSLKDLETSKVLSQDVAQVARQAELIAGQSGSNAR